MSATPPVFRAPSAPGNPLGPVVEALCSASEAFVVQRKNPHIPRIFPSRPVIYELLEDLRSVLFPGYFGPSELTAETLRFHTGATLDKVARLLGEQILRGFCAVCEEEGAVCGACEGRASQVAADFLNRLPKIRHLLSTDVRAAYEGDPALKNPDEAIYCYPGLQAITCQRIAHELLELGVPLIPRIITEHAHSLTGVDIHPGAQIGECFFIDHGTGVVIGETAVIGANVRIYQGVTLGAKSFPLDESGHPIKGVPRHPIVEDGVTIYANATVLGRITIGKGSVIAGNVWLTHSVPPGSSVSQSQNPS